MKTQDALAVAQRLREMASDSIGVEAASTIEALCAEVERLTANATETDAAVTWATTHVTAIIAERDALRAENERLREALEKLCESADDSDGCQYGTLATHFVRNIVRAALENKT